MRMMVQTVPLTSVGTVNNPRNTEITETVILVKCRECRDFAVFFAKMP